MAQLKEKKTNSECYNVIAYKPNTASKMKKVEEKHGKFIKRRTKPKVSFGAVDVYHFDRAQGYCSVPSTGGYALGMKKKHYRKERFTIDEHQTDKKSKKKLNGSLEKFPFIKFNSLENNDYNGILTIDEDDRVKILLEAGVKLDHEERKECEYITKSRLNNGCDCEDVCNQQTCSCIKYGINCQVDRYKYPCSCSSRCKNPNGRSVFKMERIQKHFFKTTSRICLNNLVGNESNLLSILSANGRKNVKTKKVDATIKAICRTGLQASIN